MKNSRKKIKNGVESLLVQKVIQLGGAGAHPRPCEKEKEKQKLKNSLKRGLYE